METPQGISRKLRSTKWDAFWLSVSYRQSTSQIVFESDHVLIILSEIKLKYSGVMVMDRPAMM